MTGKYWFWLGVALALAGVPFGRRADAGDALLDPQQAYLGKKSEPVTYRVDFSAVVTPPYKCKVLKVWVPIPPSDEAQQVSGSTFTTFPMKVRRGSDRKGFLAIVSPTLSSLSPKGGFQCALTP